MKPQRSSNDTFFSIRWDCRYLKCIGNATHKAYSHVTDTCTRDQMTIASLIGIKQIPDRAVWVSNTKGERIYLLFVTKMWAVVSTLENKQVFSTTSWEPLQWIVMIHLLDKDNSSKDWLKSHLTTIAGDTRLETCAFTLCNAPNCPHYHLDQAMCILTSNSRYAILGCFFCQLSNRDPAFVEKGWLGWGGGNTIWGSLDLWI